MSTIDRNDLGKIVALALMFIAVVFSMGVLVHDLASANTDNQALKLEVDQLNQDLVDCNINLRGALLPKEEP